jgi:hypothetical protein
MSVIIQPTDLLLFDAKSKLIRRQGELDRRVVTALMERGYGGLVRPFVGLPGHAAWVLGTGPVQFGEFAERGCEVSEWTAARGPAQVWRWVVPMSATHVWGAGIWWGALARASANFDYKKYAKKIGKGLVDRFVPIDWRGVDLKGGFDCASAVAWCFADVTGMAFWPGLDNDLASPHLLQQSKRLWYVGEVR